MKSATQRGGGVILLSFVVALALTIMPLPGTLEALRPEWVIMVLVYWVMALPQRIGVGIAWILGLLLDVVRDALLGQYAIALALIAFIVINLHQRMRVFPIWQQALALALLVILQYILVFWIKGMTGELPSFWKMLLPAVSTLVFWTPVYLVLRQIRRRYQLS
ncbi:rod shape-determining protein MreD [Thiohalophilus thiocyanatoxydans]|uniref:Rod shape-determining protein MreD n=1 Tax=Thiohalophilus thiocyanatoxydans TaxID=381308 RepID=A0A4R8IUK1_9GAMM|nr:rod shape-determining protein MreD [Thiohalophilus thiocyanatoxydans]TDY04338.1 rod shape-determining protein MreD [Thiohalophilus thiocyanatoxydans]